MALPSSLRIIATSCSLVIGLDGKKEWAEWVRRSSYVRLEDFGGAFGEWSLRAEIFFGQPTRTVDKVQLAARLQVSTSAQRTPDLHNVLRIAASTTASSSSI